MRLRWFCFVDCLWGEFRMKWSLLQTWATLYHPWDVGFCLPPLPILSRFIETFYELFIYLQVITSVFPLAYNCAMLSVIKDYSQRSIALCYVKVCIQTIDLGLWATINTHLINLSFTAPRHVHMYTWFVILVFSLEDTILTHSEPKKHRRDTIRKNGLMLIFPSPTFCNVMWAVTGHTEPSQR